MSKWEYYIDNKYGSTIEEQRINVAALNNENELLTIFFRWSFHSQVRDTAFYNPYFPLDENDKAYFKKLIEDKRFTPFFSHRSWLEEKENELYVPLNDILRGYIAITIMDCDNMLDFMCVVYKINNQKILEAIARAIWDNPVYLAYIVQNLTNQELLAQYSHRDEAVIRKAVIKAAINQDILEYLAFEDRDREVRMLAAKKLTRPDALRRVAEIKAYEQTIWDEAETTNNEERLYEIAAKTDDKKLCQKSIERIMDKRLLAQAINEIPLVSLKDTLRKLFDGLELEHLDILMPLLENKKSAKEAAKKAAELLKQDYYDFIRTNPTESLIDALVQEAFSGNFSNRVQQTIKDIYKDNHFREKIKDFEGKYIRYREDISFAGEQEHEDSNLPQFSLEDIERAEKLHEAKITTDEGKLFLLAQSSDWKIRNVAINRLQNHELLYQIATMKVVNYGDYVLAALRLNDEELLNAVWEKGVLLENEEIRKRIGCDEVYLHYAKKGNRFERMAAIPFVTDQGVLTEIVLMSDIEDLNNEIKKLALEGITYDKGLKEIALSQDLHFSVRLKAIERIQSQNIITDIYFESKNFYGLRNCIEKRITNQDCLSRIALNSVVSNEILEKITDPEIIIKVLEKEPNNIFALERLIEIYPDWKKHCTIGHVNYLINKVSDAPIADNKYLLLLHKIYRASLFRERIDRWYLDSTIKEHGDR